MIDRTTVAAALLVLAIAGGVNAQTRQAAETATQPGAVDAKQSAAYILVGATGLGHPHGVEGKLASGHVHLGASANAGKLVFDMTSFTAETAAARRYVGLKGASDASTQKQVNANMRGADVLDVKQFPQATFDIASALPGKKPGEFILEGKFTLHGVTQAIRVPATAENAQGMVHLRGEFAVLQSKFGIKPYTKAFGAVGVADELKIWGDLWLYAETARR